MNREIELLIKVGGVDGRRWWLCISIVSGGGEEWGVEIGNWRLEVKEKKLWLIFLIPLNAFVTIF